MKKRYKRKKGPVNSKKITVDGITFASGLERYMYQALKDANIKAQYEGKTLSPNARSCPRPTIFIITPHKWSS